MSSFRDFCQCDDAHCNAVPMRIAEHGYRRWDSDERVDDPVTFDELLHG
jgi:hypothetical protein